MFRRQRSRDQDVPFADEFRSVLQLATREAARLQHAYVGTEHILLGLMADGSAAIPLFRSLGVRRQDVRNRIESICKRGTAPYSEALPYTSRVKKAFELAQDEATAQQRSSVDSSHLLIGLLREEKGVAAQLLSHEFAITVDAVQRAARGEPGAALKIVIADDSDHSITEQIIRQISEAIATRQLEPGDRLPTVRHLADLLDVAPGTVARAYNALESQGAIRTDGARGTTVADRTPPPLPASKRVQALTAMLRPVVVAGFHMGATADEHREALEHAMTGVLDGHSG